MGVEAMKVRVGADMSQLIQASNSTDNTLGNLAKSAARTQTALNALATSSNSVSKTLASTGIAANSLDSKLDNVSKTVGKSKTNYTDLSRVLQDLPYGFNGIANNLTQLIPGVGLAGLAFSALVSAITFATVGTGAWTRMLGGNKDALDAQKEAVKKAKEETQAFRDGLESAKSSALSTGLSLRAFVDIARDGNKPLAERNEALKEANKILGDHGDKLTLVNINTKAVTETVNKFTEALVQQAVAAKYADRIADLTIKQTQSAKEYNKEVATLNQYLAYNQALTKKQGLGNVNIFDLADVGKQATIARGALNGYNAITGEINDVTKDFNASIGQSVKLFGDVGTKTKEGKHVKNYSDVIKELHKELRGLNGELEGNFIDDDAFDKSLVSAYQKAIKSLNQMNAPGSKIAELQLQIDPIIEGQNFQKRFSEVIKEKVSTVSQNELFLTKNRPEFKVPIAVKPIMNTSRVLDDITRKLKEDFTKLGLDIQKTVLDSGIGSIGETIGAALGGGDVGGAFKGLLETIIGGMKQLGQAMIALGTAKIALEKFNLAPGIGTVIAGVGIIALSSLIQSALPKFAGGVTGFGGGMALVGERGPEMVRLPQGSDVIPNHRLNSITGGGQQVFIPEISLRGTDLLIAFTRAQNQQNRRG